ncbi:MAG: TolC family protein [Myxococcales bacterium]|nr:TolC family protein [Myxococcales bacterium]
MTRRGARWRVVWACLWATPAVAEVPPLTLEAALALAEGQAPAVLAARARVAEAKARQRGAAVLLTDPLEVEVWAGPRLGRDTTDVELGVGQNIPLGGQRVARQDAAAAGLAATEAAAEEAVRQALGAVAAAFVAARHDEDHHRIAAEALRLAVEIHSTARKRKAAGDVGGLDVHLAAVAEARARAALTQRAVERDVGLEGLRRLLAAEPGDVPSVGGPALPRGCADGPVVDRPGLRALDAAVAEAEAEGRLGEARGWPDLGVHLRYAQEEGVHRVLGGVRLALPVFDRRAAEVAQAQARAEGLRGARAVAERDGRAEVLAARVRCERLVAAVETFERDGLPSLEASVDLARRAHEAGALPLVELLAVQRELLEARESHARLVHDAAQASVALAAARGALP